MLKKTLKIATRKSPLAMWQANFIKDELVKLNSNLKIEILPLVTTGDKFLKDRLQNTGGKGLFVKELEEALLSNEAHIAVHSMKDVPQFLPCGLTISAICNREDPRDAFLSTKYSSIANLPLNSCVGTASLRRQSQLLILRPDLKVKLLRGNIHTRINKMKNGEYDGIILAAAGLKRMQLEHEIRETLNENIFLPACGQGALGIECLSDNTEIREIIKALNDDITATCVNAERQVNAALGGNCRAPLAVFCQPINAQTILIRAKVLNMDGTIVLESMREGSFSDSLQLAHEVSQELISQGAKNLLDALS